MYQYNQYITYMLISIILSIILISVSYLLSIRNWDSEKLSPYECGFEPLDDARGKFDIRFYLVSLIFILFDLEISYLFPFIYFINSGYLIASAFLFVLTLGFLFEYQLGVLDEI